MEETNFKIAENIEVSSTFKRIQNKNLFSSARKIDEKIEETCNNLSKDFENNQNNSYNIDNASLNLNKEFYFEDEDSNIFNNKNIEEHNGKNTHLKASDLLSIDTKKGKEESTLFNKGENSSYCEEYETSSQKELNYNCYAKENVDNLKSNEKKDLFTQEESKDTLLRSKSSFHIGNIYHRDYNDETIISSTSVYHKKDSVKKEEIEKVEHVNDDKNFYELNMDEMPNRRNLLKKIYEENSIEFKEQSGVQKQKTKDNKMLGKIFKRSEK